MYPAVTKPACLTDGLDELRTSGLPCRWFSWSGKIRQQRAELISSSQTNSTPVGGTRPVRQPAHSCGWLLVPARADSVDWQRRVFEIERGACGSRRDRESTKWAWSYARYCSRAT